MLRQKRFLEFDQELDDVRKTFDALFPKKHTQGYDRGCFEQVFVAAHLRGLRPAATSTRDTLMLRKNSNVMYFQSNSKLLLSYLFINIVQKYEYVSNAYPKQMYICIG